MLLTRLLAIVQWHHFAYLVISVALLGYGASGSLVAVWRAPLLARFRLSFTAAATLFAFSAPAGFLVAQAVPFNALEATWDLSQWGWLVALYLVFAVPFAFAAACVCLAFAAHPREAHRIYAFDIGGAAAGCVAVVAALWAWHPLVVLQSVAVLALAGGAVAAGTRRALLASLAGAAAVLALGLSPWARLDPSPYKDLSQALRATGARVVSERPGPMGHLTIVENAVVPLRHAPGLSLAAPSGPPEQLALFVDGDGPAPIQRFDGNREPLAWLDHLTSAAAYHALAKPARVLVLGSGTGTDVLQALHHRASQVDAVEVHRAIVEVVREEQRAFSGDPYGQPGVAVHVAEARAFAARAGPRYDLVQLAQGDAFGASAGGLHALSEILLYTVEAFGDYLGALAPGGILSITRWVNLPPRDTLKLVATARPALERAGIDPAASLALVRGWKTATLLVKKGAFEPRELAALRDFAAARSFDLDWLPGLSAPEANRFNVLRSNDFHEGIGALLSGARDGFAARYAFDLSPATDDRPYFHQTLRLATLPQLWSLREQGGLALVEWGYPILLATLLQALPLSLALIVAPLALSPRLRAAAAGRFPWPIAGYFAAIGFGFMFVEIAFIQKFVFVLGHPLYAVAVVLAGFLAFAAIGSRLAPRLGVASRRSLALVAATIAGLAFAYALALPALQHALLGLEAPLRVAAALALIAPLATAMGMPLPTGLAAAGARSPELIPWMWAVNGCASVVGAVLATLVALNAGFRALAILAGALYLAIPWLLPRPGAAPD